MGRSQVLYNRRHGRPGRGGGGADGGGRGSVRSGESGGAGGRGGRGSRPPPPPSRRPKEDLGDNSWRYERGKGDPGGDGEPAAEAAGDGADHDLLESLGGGHSLAEYGPAAYDAPTLSQGASDPPVDVGGGGGGALPDLDASALSAALLSLPTAERLLLPLHVADLWDERYGGGGGTAKKKTVSELRVVAEGSEARPPVLEEPGGDGDGAGGGVVGDEDAGDEEDLDAWLDSVIS